MIAAGPPELTRERFDLLVVGGGIHGAWAAWEGARRGLRVALIERGDFGGATSSNSLKIVHGGFRYLQHADLPRLRESLRERAWLAASAPHLVRPLPCVLPATGRGVRRVPLLSAAVALFDAADAAVAGPHRMPRGRGLDASELARLAGVLAPAHAPGGVCWYDAIMTSPERILVGVVRAAATIGATVARGIEAVAPLLDRGAIAGVRARVVPGSGGGPPGETFDIRAAITLNAAGPWAAAFAAEAQATMPPVALAHACNVIVDRPAPAAAVAVAHPTESRMLFAVPWRGKLMVGTGYAPVAAGEAAMPGRGPAVRAHALALLHAVSRACPALELREQDVRHVHAGLLPVNARAAARGRVELLDRPVLVDHGAHGRSGLVTVVGVKWTTAHAVAARAVTLCERRLGRTPAFAASPGDALLPGAGSLAGDGAVSAELHSLYGSEAAVVLALGHGRPEWLRPLSDATSTIGAQVAFAVRCEMAQQLDDVVLRRTGLGSLGWPGDDAVAAAARIAGELLDWSDDRRTAEIRRLHEVWPWPVAPDVMHVEDHHLRRSTADAHAHS